MESTIKIGDNYCIKRSELPLLKLLQSNNKAEKEFAQKAMEKGWNVYKTGWPDYLIIKGNRIAFVEVKDKRDPIRQNQKRILNALVNHGFNCYIWHPKKGFKKLHKEVSKQNLKALNSRTNKQALQSAGSI